MRRRLFGLLTVAAFAFGACQGTTATSSPPPASASTPASAQPSATESASASATESASASASGASASPSASASGGIDLTSTKYSPEPAGNTGGNVVLAEWQYIDTVNEYLAQAEADIEVGVMAFEDFVRTTNDLKYVPDLVKELPTTDNGQVVVNGSKMDVTWHIKDGAQWSDGSPITCDDLIGTWKWVMDKDNTGLAAGTTGWEDITGIDGAGSNTCVEHFGKIYEGYLTLVAPLLPAKYIATVPVKDAVTKLYPLSNLKSGVYSGPYIPTEAKTDAQVTMVPNPQWKTISGHDPYLAGVIWKYYGDADAMVQGFKAGEHDVSNDLNDADIPKTKDVDPKSVVIHDSLTYELNAFNSKALSAKFGDDWQTIVKAIKLATDRQAIANGPLSGNVTPVQNFISPLAWYYKDEGQAPAADPTQAGQLLDQAGWKMGSNGFRTKNGKELDLQYCTTTRQVRKDTLALIASQLKPVGIKAVVNSVPAQPDVFGGWGAVPNDKKCNLVHGNFDVAEFAYVSPLDPIGAYNVYHSSGIPDPAPHNGQNITRTKIAALDQAYDTVKNSVDLQKVKDAMTTVQDIYASDQNLYELPLYNRKDVWLVNPKLHNFTGNPTTLAGEWNTGDWWMEK